MKQDWNTGLIGDIYLERYVLGELKEAQILALEARLAADPQLKQRLQAIRDHNPVFEARYPAEKMVAKFESAIEPKPTLAERLFKRLPLGRGLQLAGAFVLLALTILPVVMVSKPSGPEITRLKGQQAELRLYRNTPVGPERVAPGDSAASGDIIQVEFHPGNFAFGAIYSVDGNGNVTLHWPTRPDASTAWATVTEYRLPEAFQLDKAPYFERFHLVVSKRPIDLENLASKIAVSSQEDENWLAAQFPKSCKVITFVLKKASHP